MRYLNNWKLLWQDSPLFCIFAGFAHVAVLVGVWVVVDLVLP